MDFTNLTALVTGASAGLGRALALELAGRGATVVTVARDITRDSPRGGPEGSLRSPPRSGPASLRSADVAHSPLADVVATIRAAGGRAHAIAADLGDKDAIHRIAGQAQAVAGPVELLINNASELGPTPLRLLLDTECEDFQRVLDVGLLGPFRLGKVIAAHMALRRRGTVVNISSDAAVAAYPTWGAYGVAKAALDHLTRIWAAELEPHGVTLFAVDPGEMDTAMHRAAIPEADPATLADPGVVARRIVDLLARGTVATGARVTAAEAA